VGTTVTVHFESPSGDAGFVWRMESDAPDDARRVAEATDEARRNMSIDFMNFRVSHVELKRD
jgi:hypothetical protein